MTTPGLPAASSHAPPELGIRELVAALTRRPTGLSSAGFPYLDEDGWHLLRDRIPILFGFGQRVLEAATELRKALDAEVKADRMDREAWENACRALGVVRQVTLTAAITAPPDLWILRQMVGWFSELGLAQRLLAGEAIYVQNCRVNGAALDPAQLAMDLNFLHARGIVEAYPGAYRIAGHPRARAVLEAGPLPPAWPASFTEMWRRVFAADGDLTPRERALLAEVSRGAAPRTDGVQNHWIPTAVETELGYRLLPVVLGLRAAEGTTDLEAGSEITPEMWSSRNPAETHHALGILAAAGWIREKSEASRNAFFVTELGARGFARGPGPFGIIETYHRYLERGGDILRHGAPNVHVRRGENIAASQDANHAAFVRANDALDRFCEDFGYRYHVFIEHAVGRGEATRIRFQRSGEDHLRYFGADLEDAAIDAAVEEQRAGRLPGNMVFVRKADIGRPAILVEALREAGVDPEGAVMMVGNGFHEVRNQTDEHMTRVFEGYERAGIILIFTEENALSSDDLRATAWNTYHAGFRYVHEKSGQGLRPAMPRPAHRAGHLLSAAWHACAVGAGYVRADAYCSRGRTIYPFTPADGHNPAVSTNHFFVPRRIAARLGI
ncbi:MAG: hypothetical protein ACE5GJ_05780 [Gemmatimonadota bacterium]